MALDPKAYKSGVVVPLAKDRALMDAVGAAIRGLKSSAGAAALAQVDITWLFSVDPGDPGDLSAHFSSLEINLNKWGGNPPSAGLIRQLLTAIRDAGLDVADAAFWGAQAKAQSQAKAELIDEFVQGLAADFPLGVVTEEHLAQAAKGAALGSVPVSELANAAGGVNLAVAADFEVPTAAVPPVLGNVTAHPDFRTVADLLTLPNQPAAVTFIDTLTIDGRSVTMSDVVDAHRRSETAKDSNAIQDAQKALGLLKSQCSTDAEVHAAIRGALFKQLGTAVSRGGTRVQQRDALVALGIDRVDAARLVTKLTAGGTAPAKPPSALIAEALAAGNLAEARRLATALPEIEGDSAERAATIARVEAAEKTKTAHVEAAERALATRDFRTAASELASALKIDAADTGLASRLSVLPPPRPDTPTLRLDGRTVAVSWPQLAEADVNYLVVRAEDTVPRDPTDGHRVGEPASAPIASDPTAPIGRRVFYSVFATRDGKQFSDPASADILVLPAPSELTAAADPNHVTLSWQMPAEAIAAQIIQHAPDGDDTTIEVTNGRSHTATRLVMGSTYGFSVRAAYATAEGREFSVPTRIEATPRGAIAPAREFDARVVSVGGADALECSWRDVEGYVVDVWALPVSHPTLPSRVANVSELVTVGGQRLAPLSGGDASGGRATRRFAIGEGVFAYVPMTMDGDGGLLGESVISGVAPRATGTLAERFGDAVKLSWVWPDGDFIMEVSWRDDGSPRSTRVTRAKYRVDGGVAISPAAGISDIQIATVVKALDEEWVSPGVPVDFQAAKPTVNYAMSLKKSLFGGPTARVILDPGGFSGEVEVELVCATGPFMPATAGDGSAVGRERVTLVAQQPVNLEFTLPKLPSPFWARLFPADQSGVVLIDPPTSQMKG